MDPRPRLQMTPDSTKPETAGQGRGAGERFALSDRALTGAIRAASAFFFLWLLVPVLTGLAFTTDDLAAQNLPFRKFYADCLRLHESFLWSPDLYGGFYLHGEGQAGMMHPFHLLLYWLLPLTTAFGLEIVSIYAFLYGGCYFLFRGWKLDRPAALFGSFLFTFGGTNLVLMEHMNAVAVVAHLPWILGAIERAFEAREARARAPWLSAVAALTGSQILLGHPQSVYFCALAEAGYVVCLMAAEARWRRMAEVAAALGMGLLTGSVQLLPTLTSVRDSVRAEPPLGFLAEMSLQPQELLQWVNPLLWKGARYDQFRGFYNYLIYFGGAVTLLLFAWLLSRREPEARRRKLIRYLGFTAFCGMFLALGKYNPIFPLYARLPVIGLFRGPARYTILADFAVASGAALALGRLRENGGELRLSPGMRAVAWLLGAAAAGSAGFALLPGAIPGLAPHLAGRGTIAAGALLVACGAGLFLAVSRRPGAAVSALVLFVLLDVTIIQGGILLLHQKMDEAFPDNDLPVDAPGPVQAGNGDRVTMLGYRLVDGYSGLAPASPIPMGTLVYARIMGARAAAIDGKWRVLPDALPLVRLRSRAVAMEHREALLRDSSLLAQSALMEHRYVPPGLERDLEQVLHFDFAAAALVEEPVTLDAAATGSLQLTAEQPGRMSLTASTTGAMLATTGVRYHEGWKVRLDGRPLATMRVDGALLGFVVPAGSHRIECRFEPEDFREGAMLSLAGVLCVALYPGAVFAATRRRR